MKIFKFYTDNNWNSPENIKFHKISTRAILYATMIKCLYYFIKLNLIPIKIL